MMNDEKNIEDSIEGKLLSVTKDNINGRGCIILIIEDANGECHEVQNNWDGSDPTHDGKFEERFQTAKNLEGKNVKTSVWREEQYSNKKWFENIKAV